jgi:hypothetical protein
MAVCAYSPAQRSSRMIDGSGACGPHGGMVTYTPKYLANREREVGMCQANARGTITISARMTLGEPIRIQVAQLERLLRAAKYALPGRVIRYPGRSPARVAPGSLLYESADQNLSYLLVRSRGQRDRCPHPELPQQARAQTRRSGVRWDSHLTSHSKTQSIPFRIPTSSTFRCTGSASNPSRSRANSTASAW